MTLRVRLVGALTALVAVGLVIFGVATYSFYAHSQYERLDDQLHAAQQVVLRDLLQQANLVSGPDSSNTSDTDARRPPVVAAPGTYAELRNTAGKLVTKVQVSTSTVQPKLATVLRSTSRAGRLFNTGSVSGSTSWRVLVAATDRPTGYSVVVATPLTEVHASLRRLVIIETVGGAALLVVLAAGAWLILRRGLRPLETMAGSARSITAGDLSQRVSPSEERTEVGQLGLALNTMLDEIETAFQAREATEQRLRQFLADASHELRTPLTSIQGFAELFRLGADKDRMKLEVIMRRIEEESARMKLLVEELLLLARLDETRAAERRPIDLAVLAADACSDAVAVAGDRPVTLDAPEPVVVLGDENHLRQAIANLVNNARHHTPDGTPIEVTARIADGSAEISVRDHGPGLDDDARAHAFDRFWRADPARVGTRAGLGLAIVAGIAEEHGGEALVTNAPGGGARFTLRLPLDRSSAI